MHRTFSRAIIRTPLLPLSYINNIRLKELSKTSIIEALSMTCTDDVMEAIYISSPEFAKKLKYIITVPQSELDLEKLLSIWLSFSKYYARMCSRATPYGLMASVGIINVSKETLIENNFKGIIHAQLDSSIVYEVSNILQENEEIKRNLLYFPNPSIYLHAKSFKYIESKDEPGGGRSFTLSKFQRNPAIDTILNFTKSGKNARTVTDFIEAKFGEIYSREDIEELLNDLIANKVLLSDYSPRGTNKTLFSYITNHLTELKESIDDAQKILLINEKLSQLTNQGCDINRQLINDIETELKKLKCNIENAPMHINLIRSFSKSSINLSAVNKVREITTLLGNINEHVEIPSLKRFKKAFVERYEDHYVPLTELLDEEIGIGYPVGNIRNNNMDGIFDNVALAQNVIDESTSKSFNKFHAFLLTKISNTLKGEPIEFSSAELKSFSSAAIKLPPSYSIYCTILSEGEIDEGNFKIILNSGTSLSAVNPINRFSVSDVEIADLCNEIILNESLLHKDKIVAEVVHTPHTRLENITFRAVSRDFEIPIESLSSVKNDNKVQLNDILVNVIGNEIKLFSRKHNKEIIPKISNSHVFNNLDALPAYNLLGDLQLDGQQNQLLWNWGPFTQLEYLPRVVIDNVICSLATWRISLSKSFPSDLSQQSSRLKEELINKGLPRYIYLRQNGDHLLMLDLSDSTCLLILLKEFKKFSQLIFHECILKEQNLFIKDSNGLSYTHELVIPFIKEDLGQQSSLSKFSLIKHSSSEKKVFFPGEDFIYIKIYCTKNIGQQILIEKLSTLFLELEKTEDLIFFIRYEDPEFHLRIRVLKKDGLSFISKIYSILAKHVTNRLVYNIKIDTYTRESNRYFDIPYHKTELLFSFDSLAIIKILIFLRKKGYERYTWIIGMKNIYSYLKSFLMNEEEMLAFCLTIKNDFFVEFGLNNKKFVKSMNAKLKDNRDLIDSIFCSTNTYFKASDKIMSAREEKISKILIIKEKNKIKESKGQLFSYIHMSMNRLFSSDQRLKEAMCYDLLCGYLLYKKNIGRIK